MGSRRVGPGRGRPAGQVAVAGPGLRGLARGAARFAHH
jgi:hypothetical protein